ncbi:class I SAM-dependent methyltransferase [Algoriphagus aquimarinus]|uniref:Methyltransferase domain-containing protein n=1 Tax=Algoriphagus aquimarinus TaxID=237018 RepID=A0A1I0VEI0_9BACT|nr:class I SAM-dependent methyltransferase [Algoriphagus aquimarinus]SFA74754.1 Methyltransferase domain-containing protein [Algoriphagus aquimarinus]
MPIDLPKSCKFCGSSSLISFEGSERMFGMGGTFAYSECEGCKSIQLDEVPTDLSAYYSNSEYYSFLPLVQSSYPRRVFKQIRMNLFLRTNATVFEPIYGYWLKKLAPDFHAKIADVGCGNGQLLYELYASGFTDLYGFDPFIEKDNVINSSLQLLKQRIEESDTSFDIIMMHHAFEHMENPTEILNACFDKLNPGGKLLIRTPVADAAVWKEKRELWVQLDAPRHLIIPTISGFEKISKAIGFNLDEVLFDSTAFQFWGTALYERGFALHQKSVNDVFSKEELVALDKKALRYNQEGKGDQVCFFLSKPI